MGRVNCWGSQAHPSLHALIEQMERAGLVSAMQSNGNREVLVKGAE